MRNKKIIYTFSLLFMLLDQIIKLLVIKNISLQEEITIIPNFFSLYYLKNNGAAFSILGNKTLFLILISVICLIFFRNYIKSLTKVTPLTIISLGMIIGGILGNLFDRLIYHSVIDYLSFIIFNYAFPVFNLADIGITVGGVLLVVDLLISDKVSKKEAIHNE